MTVLRKIEVSAGIYWVEAPKADLRVLCGCPADAVKHLMRRGLISQADSDGAAFETGPNAILLSDVMVQNGAFSNLAEFPVLQMLYRQGMIIPNHPGNTGCRPLLLGSREQLGAQLQYIHRGNYGLVSEDELIEAGVSAEDARAMMRLKLRFAFGAIHPPTTLVDTMAVEEEAVTVRPGLTLRRLRLNVFEFAYEGVSVVVDLNLPPQETYECPYPLGFYYIPREYFSVVHCGEGDGWDINRASMGSILLFQGRIYLIDVGPNILATLTALGIGVNEIEGIFHTHSHDDHFAGLTTLVRSDHRIKYYAAPMVRAAVAKKMAALLSVEEAEFSDYFDVHHLTLDQWNDIDGLEVRPVFSPHPVETTVFFFRTMWENGYRTYAHFADICRLDVLKGFVTDDPAAPGLSAAWFERIRQDYATPADLKKVDVGGGLIHGDAIDFRDDRSGKVILAHTSNKLTVTQRTIGSAAAFGTVDPVIDSDRDFIWSTAEELLRSIYPDVPRHQIRVLLNTPMVTFNPSTILLRERQPTGHVYIILSGSVEAIPSESGGRILLSAGAMVGELPSLFGALSTETYRALGYVKALKIPASLYGEFVRRNHLVGDITRLLDRREFLQRTWLFAEVVSTKTLNHIARQGEPRFLSEGVTADVGPESMGLVERGRIGRFIGEHMAGTLGPGDVFGAEQSVFHMPSMFRLRALEPTDVLVLPASAVAGIPSVRWRLFEAWGRHTSVLVEGGGSAVLRWQDEHRTNVHRLDNHHRRLFELANAVADIAASGGDPRNVADALDALIAYSRYHFREEEYLLKRNGYPEVDAHRREHERMMVELMAFGATVIAGDDHDVPGTLERWLLGHILDHDNAVGRFLNAKGVY
jgi:hemerythrin